MCLKHWQLAPRQAGCSSRAAWHGMLWQHTQYHLLLNSTAACRGVGGSRSLETSCPRSGPAQGGPAPDSITAQGHTCLQVNHHAGGSPKRGATPKREKAAALTFLSCCCRCFIEPAQCIYPGCLHFIAINCYEGFLAGMEKLV